MIEFTGWRKSSHSSEGACVEVGRAADLDTIGVRDTKDRNGPVLAFDAADWKAFLTTVR